MFLNSIAMVIEAPEWDSGLTGHTAVSLDREESTICHAVVSAYLNGEQIPRTECGHNLHDEWTKPRGNFDTSKYIMCVWNVGQKRSGNIFPSLTY